MAIIIMLKFSSGFQIWGFRFSSFEEVLLHLRKVLPIDLIPVKREIVLRLCLLQPRKRLINLRMKERRVLIIRRS